MSAVHLQAGTITTDLLHASVGQELEIGSNKALMLYATVDGYRPSGGLKTKVSNGDGTYSEVGEGDSWIEIAAKETTSSGSSPAHIDIRTGGILNLSSNSEMNLTSSKMNLTAAQMNQDVNSEMNVIGGVVNIQANKEYDSEGHEFVDSGKLNILADSEMYVDVGGNITMETGGTFTLKSNNVLIDPHGNALFKGTLIAWAGRIAGFTIAGEVVPETGYSETITLPSFDDFPETGTEDTLYIAEDTEKNYYWTGETYEETKVSYDDNNHPTSMPISGYKYKRQYIYAGDTKTVSDIGNGVYIGTDGLNLGGRLRYNFNSLIAEADKVVVGKLSSGDGALLSMDSTTGEIKLLSTSTVSIAATSSINIAAKNEVNITTNGVVNIGDMSSAFTIGKRDAVVIHDEEDPDNPEKDVTIPAASFIYNGMTTLSDTTHTGVYVGTDGIALGKGLFKVTNLGELEATSATIRGTVYATEGWFGCTYDRDNDRWTGGWILNSNLIYSNDHKTGLSSTVGVNGAGIAFWAGNRIDDLEYVVPAFSVTHSGYLTSTTGSIGGWNILDNTFTSTNGDVGMYTVNVDKDGYNVGTAAKPNIIAIWAGSSTPSSAPFYITHGGNLHATGAYISGEIHAGSGEFNGTITAEDGIIGGWNILPNQLYSTNYAAGMMSVAGSANVAFWAGASSSSGISTAKFRVTQGGKLYATDAEISAINGSHIGAFTIEGDELKWVNGTDFMWIEKGAIEIYESGQSYVGFTTINGRYVQANEMYTYAIDNVQTINRDGWLRDAEVKNDTLTITKSDGTTVNFKKAGTAVDHFTFGYSGASMSSTFSVGAYDDDSNFLGATTGYVDLDWPYNNQTWAVVYDNNGNQVAYTSLSDYWDAAQEAARSGNFDPTNATKINVDGTEYDVGQVDVISNKITIYYGNNNHVIQLY